LDKTKILHGNIRYMKIYCGKFLSQMKIGNIIFQMVKISKVILSNKTFMYCLGHI